MPEKIDEKFQNGQTPSASWKVEENQIIKRQNCWIKYKFLLKKYPCIDTMEGAIETLEESREVIRHDGDNDKTRRGTAESYGRDGTGIAGTDRQLLGFQERTRV